MQDDNIEAQLASLMKLLLQYMFLSKGDILMMTIACDSEKRGKELDACVIPFFMQSTNQYDC